MNNNLITVSPSVTGNVGSCKTEYITVTVGRSSPWKFQKKDIATNSCTGEVSTFEYYEYTPLYFIGIFVCILIPLIIVSMIFGRD